LILTRDSALEFLGEVTVAPVTSTIREIPSEVLLTEADGVPSTPAAPWLLRTRRHASHRTSPL
jgi:mRNA-degrading endonuclease toxin of MazEF toxin-antitoxin module